jgi:UDP-galactopyranose mutase
MYDALIVGAGFAGSVSAQILAQKGFKVLVLEERDHIGGNCYDELVNGVLVHRYGPHLFHTSDEEVWEFLSQFTKWTSYEHHVKAHIDGLNVPIPFNFNSICKLFEPNKADELIKRLLKYYKLDTKVPILELKKHPDLLLQKLADFVYEKVFLGYTAKQWGLKPEELDSAVTARVPLFIGWDDRYFNDTFQAVPKDGYTKLFENLLNHPNITLKLSCVFELDAKFDGVIVYTGMIDRLFNYCHKELSYRSINLEFETVDKKWFQDAPTINFPNNYDFTRITEFKHIHPSNSPKTVILKEYPTLHVKGKTEPFYPFFTKEAKEHYLKYVKLAKEHPNLVLLGRLAEYRYYDMDDVVKRVIDFFRDWKSR